jgi:hypothetical protein
MVRIHFSKGEGNQIDLSSCRKQLTECGIELNGAICQLQLRRFAAGFASVLSIFEALKLFA